MFLVEHFGSANDRSLKAYQRRVPQINALEPEFAALSDDGIIAKTAEFKARVAKGESLDALLPEAFANCREAARRAGINVRAVYSSAFVLCAVLAAFGGVLASARLASASQQAGTGDVNLNAIAAAVIGGTSLFGGRGSAYSALLGIIVIQSISSGLTLLDLSSSLRYMITGAVLAVAVIVDSLARQSRVSHGRA